MLVNSYIHLNISELMTKPVSLSIQSFNTGCKKTIKRDGKEIACTLQISIRLNFIFISSILNVTSRVQKNRLHKAAGLSLCS